MKWYFAAYPEEPPRTRALEQTIEIGTGFHDSWYQSQKECWLGWLVAKDCEARSRGQDPFSIDAEVRWNHLLSSPLMFWAAECAGVPETLLDQAEQAATEATRENPRSGHPHGTMMRAILPWSNVEGAILENTSPLPVREAEDMAREAFDKLCELRSEFRELRAYLVD